ncbi:hypothetical protein [Dactylosporangium sp. CA-139066]|uniref:hypothetical protein n=1 Tax=Dactylosporangium sp. CA-139066 TaxID=3239930 RepID=UPI003D9324D2
MSQLIKVTVTGTYRLGDHARLAEILGTLREAVRELEVLAPGVRTEGTSLTIEGIEE